MLLLRSSKIFEEYYLADIPRAHGSDEGRFIGHQGWATYLGTVSRNRADGTWPSAPFLLFAMPSD